MTVPRRFLIAFFIILIAIPLLSFAFIWARDNTSLFRQSFQVTTKSNLPGYNLNAKQSTIEGVLTNLGVLKDGVKLRTKGGGFTPANKFNKLQITLTSEVQPYDKYLGGDSAYASISESIDNQTLNVNIYLKPESFIDRSNDSLSKMADRLFIEELYFLHNLGNADGLTLFKEGGDLASKYQEQKISILRVTKS